MPLAKIPHSKTLIIGTTERRLIFGYQKPCAKPKHLLKVFDPHLKEVISCDTANR